MYRAGIEGILGLRREGTFLVVSPRLPSSWPEFSAKVTFDGARCTIRVRRGPSGQVQAVRAILDDTELDCGDKPVRVALDGKCHCLEVFVE
jgi:cyclic beta-1,2-glucan synthetase